MEILKTMFFVGLYVVGILLALSMIFATIGVWVDKIREPKRKKQQLEDAMKYLKELQKLGETTEKPKKTTKRTTKKTTKDEEK